MNRYSRNSFYATAFRIWDGIGTFLWNAVTFLFLTAFLFPLVFMLFTSLKEAEQFRGQKPPVLPSQLVTWSDGEKTYPLYYVPTENGLKEYALVKAYQRYCEFLNPQNPDARIIRVEMTRHQLDQVYRPYYTLESFAYLLENPNFQNALLNTLKITLMGVTAATVSSVLVAYGFSRFRFPFGRILFLIMLGTIMIPDKVTLIPTLAMFVVYLNWDGTYLPIIVPYLFGNAIMIFLLHQNFRRIPQEQEEAATIDGAGPVRFLMDIVLPQSIPVLVTVVLLQFFLFWNDLRSSLLYLSITPELQPISAWMQQDFSFGFHPPNVLQATALLSMIIPALVLILSQGVFMKGIKITGLEK